MPSDTATVVTETFTEKLTSGVISGVTSGLVTAGLLAAIAAGWRWRRRPLLEAELAHPSPARGLPPVSFLLTLENKGRTALRDFWVQVDLPAELSPAGNATARMSERRGEQIWGVFHVQADRALPVQGKAEIAYFTCQKPVEGVWDLPVVVRSTDAGTVLETTVRLDLAPASVDAPEDSPLPPTA